MNNILIYLEELYPNVGPELKSNNDFEFLIAVVLSAQCTDKKVNKATKVLFEEYNIDTLSKANIEDLEKILKPLGMFKKKALYIKSIANDIVNIYNYKVPNTMKELTKLNGVGRKTANVVLSQIYKMPCMPVDTHIMRISKRLGIACNKDSAFEIEKKILKLFPKEKLIKLHLQLIAFGRNKCTARSPKCSDCKLKDICTYKKK